MNAKLFKLSLILKLDEFIKEHEGLENLPTTFDGWFEYFLDYSGYTIEEQEE